MSVVMPPKPSARAETSTPAPQTNPESAQVPTPPGEWAEEMNQEAKKTADEDAGKQAKKSKDTIDRIQTTDGAEENPESIYPSPSTPSFLTRLRASASSNTAIEAPASPSPEDRHDTAKIKKHTRRTMLDVRTDNPDYHAFGNTEIGSTSQVKCGIAEEVGLLNERVTNLERAVRETRAYWGKQFDAGFDKTTKDLNNLETNARGSVSKLGQRVSALENTTKGGPLDMEDRLVKLENLVKRYYESQKSLEELSRHTTTELKKLNQASKEHQAVQREQNKKISGLVERTMDMFGRAFRRIKDLEEKSNGF